MQELRWIYFKYMCLLLIIIHSDEIFNELHIRLLLMICNEVTKDHTAFASEFLDILEEMFSRY